MTTTATDRRRWLALYVLCLGMLMISGYHLAFLVGATLVGGAIAVALRISLPRRAHERRAGEGAPALRARAGSAEAR